MSEESITKKEKSLKESYLKFSQVLNTIKISLSPKKTKRIKKVKVYPDFNEYTFTYCPIFIKLRN